MVFLFPNVFFSCDPQSPQQAIDFYRMEPRRSLTISNFEKKTSRKTIYKMADEWQLLLAAETTGT